MLKLNTLGIRPGDVLQVGDVEIRAITVRRHELRIEIWGMANTPIVVARSRQFGVDCKPPGKDRPTK